MYVLSWGLQFFLMSSQFLLCSVFSNLSIFFSRFISWFKERIKFETSYSKILGIISLTSNARKQFERVQRLTETLLTGNLYFL